MLRVCQLEEIRGRLMLLPSLIDRMEAHDPAFLPAVHAWCTDTEQVLIRCGLPAAARVSALRGTLDLADRGALPPDLALGMRTTRRRAREVAATYVLREGSLAVESAVQEDLARIAEAEQIARELLVIARSHGIPLTDAASAALPGSYAELWQALAADPELSVRAARLLALVGQQDSLVILSRTLRDLVESR